MAKLARIALLIESSRAFGRGLLRGVADYARVLGSWSIDYHHEWALGNAVPASMKDWRGDGIIVRFESRKLIRQIEQMGLPTVDLRGLHDVEGVPVVSTDMQIEARLAADHLLERGFEHFAYCGFGGMDYSERRCRYFVQYLAEAGYEPSVYQEPPEARTADTQAVEAMGLLHKEAVAAWIESLSKPLGLMACNDIRAQQVLNICRERGIAVPGHVAVIGVDNDQVLCDLCEPPLSSVEPNTREIGYQGAALLDRMINGQRPPIEKSFIEPLGVVTRQSTDVVAIADHDTASAVQFIREHACDGICVKDVLEQVVLSRSTLERGFAKFLGRSPKAEIVHVRIQRVKQLLTTTDLPLATITRLAGFNHVEAMCKLFKKKTGRTPGDYRKTPHT